MCQYEKRHCETYRMLLFKCFSYYNFFNFSNCTDLTKLRVCMFHWLKFLKRFKSDFLWELRNTYRKFLVY